VYFTQATLGHGDTAPPMNIGSIKEASFNLEDVHPCTSENEIILWVHDDPADNQHVAVSLETYSLEEPELRVQLEKVRAGDLFSVFIPTVTSFIAFRRHRTFTVFHEVITSGFYLENLYRYMFCLKVF